jgi:hypothetical protein
MANRRELDREFRGLIPDFEKTLRWETFTQSNKNYSW